MLKSYFDLLFVSVHLKALAATRTLARSSQKTLKCANPKPSAKMNHSAMVRVLNAPSSATSSTERRVRASPKSVKRATVKVGLELGFLVNQEKRTTFGILDILVPLQPFLIIYVFVLLKNLFP